MAGVVRNDLDSERVVEAYNLNKTISEKDLIKYTTLISSGAKLSLNQSIDDVVMYNALDKYYDNYKAVLSQDNLFLDFDSYSRITDETIKKLSILSPKLKKINLKSCINITDQSLTYLADNCHQLEELNLSWCDITAKSLFIIAEGFPNLRRINVSSCYITDEGVNTLLTKCQDLEILGLAWCKSISDKSLESLIKLGKNVKVFDIRGNEKISSGALSNLFSASHEFSAVHLKRCHGVNGKVIGSLCNIGSHLEKLNLRGVYRDDNITNQDLVKLFDSCNNIKSLDIAWHKYITLDTLTYLSHNCPNLQELDLSGCELINENSLKELFANCQKLSLVILFNNVLISSESVQKLSEEYKHVNIKIYN